MKALLDYLERRSRTLTVYDYTGTDEAVQGLSEWLDSYGVHVRTAETDRAAPEDVALLHREGEVLGACSVDELLARADFEAAIEEGTQPSLPAMLAGLSTDVTVKPNRSVQQMVRISRDFERRALREGAGQLHAGFQHLSQVADSTRTMEMYTALAREGVDVRVYGYPDATLEDVPFTVVEDAAGDLEQYWFLLYDGGGNPHRKAALVSEECPPSGGRVPTATADTGAAGTSYDSFFTTDPETVDDLFELAREAHGDLLTRGE